MKSKTLLLTLSGTFLALAGCSTYDRPRAALDVRPFSAINHGVARGDALYALGRYYQGQVRYDQAIESYRQLLADNPEHAEAHNALGVIYSLQGRHEQAEAEFAAALASAPAAAHIHGNLGYEYLRQGRFDEALAALQEAARLDPDNIRVASHLQQAKVLLAVRDGQPEPMPSAATGAVAPPLAAEVAVAAVASPDEAPAMRLASVAPQVYELQLPERRPETLASRQGAPVDQIASGFEARRARLEVANGNGIGGLAHRTASVLQRVGYNPVRLTNQKPYRQQVTEIQYRPGFEPQAQKLNRMFAETGVLAQVSQLRSDVEVRVVLGRNLRSTSQMAALEAALVQLAAADIGSTTP